MAVQEKPVTNEILYKLVLSLQQEIKGVREDCAKLREEMTAMTTFMVRTKTAEEVYNLPARLEAHDARIDAIEKRETEFRSELRGQVNTLKAVVAVVSFIGAVLGLWLAVKQLSGR